MNIAIDKNFINTLKNSEGGLLKLTLQECKSISNLLEDDTCKVILLDKQCFVVFSEIVNVEFAIINYIKQTDLSFLTSKHIQLINATKDNGSYARFILNELFQGRKVGQRLTRLAKIAIPLLILNLLGVFYGNQEAIGEVFSGLLTAVSIFVAIFSLFVTSHDYLTRKRLALFESGQLGYYFSVDKYITQTGVYAIVLSIFGLVTTSGYEKSAPLYTSAVQDIIVIILLNLTFIAVYVILRSMIEFYIVRPGKFIMSDLKVESFAKYRKDNK